MRITQEMWRTAFDVADEHRTRTRAARGLPPAPANGVRLTPETFEEARRRIARRADEPAPRVDEPTN